jgi:hypothetical protein
MHIRISGGLRVRKSPSSHSDKSARVSGRLKKQEAGKGVRARWASDLKEGVETTG